MANSVVYVNKDVRYFKQPHYCPQCRSELKVVKVSKVLDGNSDEAKKIDTRRSRTVIGSKGISFKTRYYVGDVEYIYNEFECESCAQHFSLDEIKESEGIVSQPKTPEELKKIKIERFIFNKLIPLAIIIAIAVIRYFLKN